MPSEAAVATVVLNDNPEVIDRLRRIGQLDKDEYGEYYTGQFNAMGFKFYLGMPREIPLVWAEGIRNSYVMPIDAPCMHCRGVDDKPKGYTIAGLCQSCKGSKWVDTGKQIHLFKITGENDPMTFNPAKYNKPPEKTAEPTVTA